MHKKSRFQANTEILVVFKSEKYRDFVKLIKFFGVIGTLTSAVTEFQQNFHYHRYCMTIRWWISSIYYIRNENQILTELCSHFFIFQASPFVLEISYCRVFFGTCTGTKATSFCFFCGIGCIAIISTSSTFLVTNWTRYVKRIYAICPVFSF